MSHELLSILNFSRKYFWYYFSGFILLVITNFIANLLPVFFKRAVDEAQKGPQFLFFFMLSLMGMAFLQFLVRSISRILVYRACREQENELREELVLSLLFSTKLRSLGIHRGDFVTNMVEDTTQFRIFVGFGFIQIANIVLAYVFAIPMMIKISPFLTFVSLAPLPFLILFISVLNHKLYVLNLRIKEVLAEVHGFLSEAVHGIHVIHSFQAHNGISRGFNQFCLSYFQTLWQRAKIEVYLFPGLLLLAGLGEWAAIHYGAFMIATKEMTQGDLLAFQMYMAFLLMSTIMVGFGMSTFNRGFTSWQRLQKRFSLLSIPRKNQEILGSCLFDRIQKEKNQNFSLTSGIKIRNLDFSWGNGGDFHLSIPDFDMDLSKNIGICGPIGSGKSTLVQLLTGEFPEYLGSVFDDQDKNIETECLRKWFCAVYQDSFLFSDSILENIDFGRNISLEESEMALKKAQFFEDVALFSQGVDTIVGENGVRLSLGQKQRLCFARTMVRMKNILILDDCFSALDALTEEAILGIIFSQKNGGVLLVSHRISSLSRCDQILVMEKGKIVAFGTHEELIRQSGFYKEIHDLQKEWKI